MLTTEQKNEYARLKARRGELDDLAMADIANYNNGAHRDAPEYVAINDRILQLMEDKANQAESREQELTAAINSLSNRQTLSEDDVKKFVKLITG